MKTQLRHVSGVKKTPIKTKPIKQAKIVKHYKNNSKKGQK